MKAFIALFCLVAVACADYTPSQEDEVFNDILHEVAPFISVDKACLKAAGISSGMCLLTGIPSCIIKISPLSIAACLAGKCGGQAASIVKCIKL